jgi:hypothetical protein
MGEETNEAPPKEEAPMKEKKPKVKKERAPREGPFFQMIAPEGSPKIVALMAALSILLQGSNLFWAGLNFSNPVRLICGIFLFILGLILILTINILNFGDPTLKRIEVFEKFYRFEVLLIIGLVVIFFEMLSIFFALGALGALAVMLGGFLVITSSIMEIFIKKEKIMKPSKLVALIGIIITIVEIIYLFAIPNVSNIWDACVGIVVLVLLLLSMYEKIKFIPYQWWMVLILGFVLFGWVSPGTGGTFVLISFILMLLEK